jgi:hypothetical protein
MKKRLIRVAPLQAGMVAGALYLVFGLIIGLIMAPIMFFSAALAGRMQFSGALSGAVASLFILIGIPIFYGILGFIGGIIAAAIYNLVAHFTGGLEFEVRDVVAVA